MAIRVEFYGIPRRRAGVAQTTVPTEYDGARLGDVLRGWQFSSLRWRETASMATGSESTWRRVSMAGGS